MDAINQIKVRNFEYRTADEIDLNEWPETVTNGDDVIVNHTGTQLGAIAQEIESILPGSVTNHEGTGKKELSTDPILWALVNAVKELSTKVTALENA